MKKLSFCTAALALASLLASGSALAQTQRIKELATLSGQRPNQLIGYGLVVGLDGTGDTAGQSPYAGQSLANMLAALGVALPPNTTPQARNVAAVMVTAELEELARPGQKMDVTVSSMGNARSLRGGTLLMTPLKAADGQVYGQAQGSVVVPGAGISTRQTLTQISHQSAGRIPSGALVEVAAPEAPAQALVELNFKLSDFAQTERAVQVIASALGADVVQPVNARTISLRAPAEPGPRMAFMARLMELQVPRIQEVAKVVINARTGSVLINQSVQLLPFAVTHGALTIRVQSQNRVIQPPALALGATTRTEQNQSVTVDTGPAGNLVQVPSSASLDDLVRALNRLGATPQDLMAILQAMKAAGALQAELEII
jgi:flagellar P-ring protein precursor FlgI